MKPSKTTLEDLRQFVGLSMMYAAILILIGNVTLNLCHAALA